uniref:SAP30-binding protein n=1 Tax=Haptolina brevifila TaxID=156173 RepID=A0A7S2JS36_9EUKA|mmetsp:Transcript_9112/g.18511  ORF Transcript_9112/g.18511 Transcript_9112/m.18511 type:complete len:278 (+) Transcript_9112:132-965(+)
MSSLLGLADYDDSPAQVSGDSPAADGVASAPAGSGLLTIVDYPLDAEDKVDSIKPDLGISLDDEALVRPRKVGSVQMSVVKRTPPRPLVADDGEAVAAALSAPGDQGDSSTSEAVRPNFVPPDSPPGDVNPKVLEKYLGYVKNRQEGKHVNDYIRHTKRFRNPDLLEKLVGFMDVTENGTNYPADLYDPNSFGKEEYYEQLERSRKAYEEKQSRKPGERVEFRSSGNAPPQSQAEAQRAASSAAGDAAPAPAKRKSKWDTGGGGGGNDDPPSQRPRN